MHAERLRLEPVDDLVARATDGDEQAWKAIVDRFATLVWAICRSCRLSDPDAADVSQTVWLRAVEHLPALRQPAALPGWLATTTRRECLRTVRHPGPRAEMSFEVTPGEAPADPAFTSPDALLVSAQLGELLRAAVRELPPQCQRLLELLLAEQPPAYAAVSCALGIPVGSIGPTRARCLEKLRANRALQRWMSDVDTEREDPHR
jgi:RNA polymerase sigma factor (sigma-70 family)